MQQTENHGPVSGEIEVGGRKKATRGPQDYSSVMREFPHSNGVMSSFMVRPKGVEVEVQGDEEKILLIVREHFITNWKWILLVIFLLWLPLMFTTQPYWSLLPGNFQFMTMVFWYFMVVTIALQGFLSWYFDLMVVTDERMIDIDFYGLIYKNITTAKIDDIQDVTFSVNGPLASLLNYGNVLVQTAGAVVSMKPQETIPTIEIWNTPHPSKVAKLINELMLEEEQEAIEGRVR